MSAVKILALFQKGILSAGKAAEILGTTKSGFLHLLDLRSLPYLDASYEEVERQADVAVKAARPSIRE